MYSNQRSNEILLDFRGLFWSFFSQWKAFLIFALIVSMLLTGFNYKKSMDAYDAAVAEANERSLSAAEAQARIDESMGMLSSVERANRGVQTTGLVSLMGIKFQRKKLSLGL